MEPTKSAKFAELTIDGEVYRLGYDFGAVRRTEGILNLRRARDEPKVNLLRAIMLVPRYATDARELHGLLCAALEINHPKLTVAAIDRLIRIDTMPAISDALVCAWDLSLPTGEIEDDASDAPPSSSCKESTC